MLNFSLRGEAARSERDSSGTTEATEGREGDGANSPTQATKKASRSEAFFVRAAARPNYLMC